MTSFFDTKKRICKPMLLFDMLKIDTHFLCLFRFMEPAVITVLGGVLPFGSIFIEMYFIFTSFWAYKIYYVYGFMLLVFLILLVVTVCVTIVCTYFLLNAEDYRWYSNIIVSHIYKFQQEKFYTFSL